jgi:hypothetical protein
LVSPSGLLGDLIRTFSAPLRELPGPIGELATNAVAALSTGITNLLSVLPAPIPPRPLPSAARITDPVPADSGTTSGDMGISSVPEPSLEPDNAVSLRSIESVGTPTVAPATDVQQSTVGEITAPAPVSDGGGKPLTNVKRPGLKVEPGDTFAGVGDPVGTEIATDTDPVTTDTADISTTPQDVPAGEGPGDPGAGEPGNVSADAA